MAQTVINNGNLTLLDQMLRRDPNGAMAVITELLQAQSPLLQDMVVKEGNLPTGELVTYRGALPPVSYSMFNKGIDATKSRTGQFKEACASMKTRSQLDCELAEFNGNSAEFRGSEEMPNLEALTQEAESGMFYNTVIADPEKWNGLAPRFAATTQAMGGSQIVLGDAAASGSDQTSVWLIGWSDRTVYGIFPKGSKAGITAKDGGPQLVEDEDGKRFWAYVTDWTWKLGLVVRDYRYVARVCNIDTSALSETGDNIMKAMIRAWHKTRAKGGCRWAWYCNGNIGTYLHLQALEKTVNSTLTIEEIGGTPITKFLKAPVRETDGILSTESVIS